MLYGVFVAATTILVLITMMIPAVNEVYNTVPLPKIAEAGNKYLVLFALTIVTIITAPIMLVVCMVPSFSERFIDTLTADLKKG